MNRISKFDNHSILMIDLILVLFALKYFNPTRILDRKKKRVAILLNTIRATILPPRNVRKCAKSKTTITKICLDDRDGAITFIRTLINIVHNIHERVLRKPIP